MERRGRGKDLQLFNARSVRPLATTQKTCKGGLTTKEIREQEGGVRIEVRQRKKAKVAGESSSGASHQLLEQVSQPPPNSKTALSQPVTFASQ